MEKNIFENATFGDKFLTRDGRIAMFVMKTPEGFYQYITKENGKNEVYPNGRFWTEGESGEDIISAIGDEEYNEDCIMKCENCKWFKENEPCNHDIGIGFHISTCFLHKNYQGQQCSTTKDYVKKDFKLIINEDKLDELADEHFERYELMYDGVSREERNVAYKNGYKKAIEEYENN